MPNDPFYKSVEYKVWARQVLAQGPHDEHGRPLCVRCLRFGRRTVATVAHHKKNRKDYPELAFVASNGDPLCAACHNEEHPEKGSAPKKRPPLSPKRFY